MNFLDKFDLTTKSIIVIGVIILGIFFLLSQGYIKIPAIVFYLVGASIIGISGYKLYQLRTGEGGDYEDYFIETEKYAKDYCRKHLNYDLVKKEWGAMRAFGKSTESNHARRNTDFYGYIFKKVEENELEEVWIVVQMDFGNPTIAMVKDGISKVLYDNKPEEKIIAFWKAFHEHYSGAPSSVATVDTELSWSTKNRPKEVRHIYDKPPPVSTTKPVDKND